MQCFERRTLKLMEQEELDQDLISLVNTFHVDCAA